MMDNWNKENPGKEVRRGDRIMLVNDKKGDIAIMLKEITEKPTLTMQVERPGEVRQ